METSCHQLHFDIQFALANFHTRQQLYILHMMFVFEFYAHVCIITPGPFNSIHTQEVQVQEYDHAAPLC